METATAATGFFPCVEFKSYYVVWKQKYNARGERIYTSLNRTMQYGNKKKIAYIETDMAV